MSLTSLSVSMEFADKGDESLLISDYGCCFLTFFMLILKAFIHLYFSL